MSGCIELDGRKYRLFKVKGLFEIDGNEFGNYEAHNRRHDETC